MALTTRDGYRRSSSMLVALPYGVLQWEREDPGDLRYATLLGVAPTPSGLVAVGVDSTPRGELPGAWTSSEGADWTPGEIATPFSVDEWWMPEDVALAGSGLAQVVGSNRYGDGPSTILVSEDGRSWVPGVTSPPVSDAHLRRVTAFGDHFVAIGSARNPGEPGQAGIWRTLEPSELSPETDGPAEPEPEPVECDASTTPDLLPGVYRVLGDGVRGLRENVWDIATAADGDAWVEKHRVRYRTWQNRSASRPHRASAAGTVRASNADPGSTVRSC